MFLRKQRNALKIERVIGKPSSGHFEPFGSYAEKSLIQVSVEHPSKDSQRFIEAIVLISPADWSKTVSNFENVVQTPFEPALKH